MSTITLLKIVMDRNFHYVNLKIKKIIYGVVEIDFKLETDNI